MHYTILGLHRFYKYEKLFTNENSWYQNPHDYLNRGRKRMIKFNTLSQYIKKTFKKLGAERNYLNIIKTIKVHN